ncbi:hypothetical protein VPH35_032189 [Triticum aestivum]
MACAPPSRPPDVAALPCRAAPPSRRLTPLVLLRGARCPRLLRWSHPAPCALLLSTNRAATQHPAVAAPPTTRPAPATPRLTPSSCAGRLPLGLLRSHAAPPSPASGLRVRLLPPGLRPVRASSRASAVSARSAESGSSRAAAPGPAPRAPLRLLPRCCAGSDSSRAACRVATLVRPPRAVVCGVPRAPSSSLRPWPVALLPPGPPRNPDGSGPRQLWAASPSPADSACRLHARPARRSVDSPAPSCRVTNASASVSRPRPTLAFPASDSLCRAAPLLGHARPSIFAPADCLPSDCGSPPPPRAGSATRVRVRLRPRPPAPPRAVPTPPPRLWPARSRASAAGSRVGRRVRLCRARPCRVALQPPDETSA